MFASKRLSGYECTIGNRGLRLVMPTFVLKMFKAGDHFKIRSIAALRAMYPEIEISLVEAKWIVEYLNGQPTSDIKSYAYAIMELNVIEMPQEEHQYGSHMMISLNYRAF